MTTYTMDELGDDLDHAIRRSITHNEIVTIETDSREHAEQIESALLVEAADDDDASSVDDNHGTIDVWGDGWRINVTYPTGE